VTVEQLLEALARGEPEARDALRRMGPAAAEGVPALVEMVAGGDRRRRLDAMFVLEGLATAAAPAVPALLEALRDADGVVSVQAADTLGSVGSAGVPGLVEALGDRDAHVRQGACHALGVVGKEAGDAVPALLKRLGPKEDGSVRERAVWALGEIGDQAALEPLIEIFSEEGAAIGCWIAEAIGRFGRRARPVADALRDELHRDDPDLALASAAALRRVAMYEDAAVWALVALLQGGRGGDQGGRGGDADLRVEAAILLGEYGSKAAAAVPALRAAESDASEEVRAQATLALAKIRPQQFAPATS